MGNWCPKCCSDSNAETQYELEQTSENNARNVFKLQRIGSMNTGNGHIGSTEQTLPILDSLRSNCVNPHSGNGHIGSTEQTLPILDSLRSNCVNPHSDGKRTGRTNENLPILDSPRASFAESYSVIDPHPHTHEKANPEPGASSIDTTKDTNKGVVLRTNINRHPNKQTQSISQQSYTHEQDKRVNTYTVIDQHPHTHENANPEPGASSTDTAKNTNTVILRRPNEHKKTQSVSQQSFAHEQDKRVNTVTVIDPHPHTHENANPEPGASSTDTADNTNTVIFRRPNEHTETQSVSQQSYALGLNTYTIVLQCPNPQTKPTSDPRESSSDESYISHEYKYTGKIEFLDARKSTTEIAVVFLPKRNHKTTTPDTPESVTPGGLTSSGNNRKKIKPLNNTDTQSAKSANTPIPTEIDIVYERVNEMDLTSRV